MTADVAAPVPMTLRIARVEPLADGVFGYDLRALDGSALPRFEAGAHVTVWLPGGGTRCYSLANDPAERDRYEIAVKRETVGRGGSSRLVDGVRKGDMLGVSAPDNWFALAPNIRDFLFIAGGIGITPIMSMIRQLNATAAASYRLYYLTRSPAHTPFLADLRAPAFDGKVIVHHDGGDPARAFDLWPLFERPTKAHIYCCGPQGLMDGVRDMTGHWPSSAIHFEAFANARATPRADDRPFVVRLARSGASIEVAAGVSILDAVRARGCQVPSSCESGTCGTCKTRLLGGDPDHRDLVLSDAERADHIMVCVSRARSAELVLDL